MVNRQRRNRWVMWVILAVMVVGLAGLGLNSTIGSSQGSTVLKVGKSEISADEYYNALRTRIDDITRQQGTAMTIEQARLTGITEQVQSELINRATMSEIARRNNLRASDEAVSLDLLEINAFQDTNGKFNRNNFELFLKNRGLTENEFLDSIRSNLERGLVIDVLDQQDIEIPAISNSIAKMVGETRAVDFVMIDKNQITDLVSPSEADIRARYDENPENFMADPVRHFQIAYLLPDVDAVAQDEVQKYYDEHPEQFGQLAQLSYEVLSFPDEAAAKAFYDNPDFEAVATERGLSAEDYSYTDQPFSALPEDAQNQLADGELKIYPPVQSLLGWNVYKVNSFTPATTKPIDEVEGEIRKLLATDALNSLLATEYDSINDAIAGGAKPQELADGSSLDFVEWTSAESAIIGLSDQAEFANEASAAQIDEERELVKLENGGVFILMLTAQDEAKPAKFEDIKSEIKAQMEVESLGVALDARAESIREKSAQDGLESVAEADALKLEKSAAVTSQTSFNTIPLPIAFELFQRNEDEVWVTGDDERRYVVKISKVEAFKPDTEEGEALLSTINEQINGSVSEAMIIDYLNAAAQEYGAVKYPALLEQVEAQIR